MSPAKGTFSEASAKKKEKQWITDELIHGQVIDKCRSSELGTDLPIAKLQEIACSFEAVDIQLIAMLAKNNKTSALDSDNDEYALTVDSKNIGGMVIVQLGGVSMEGLINSGASTSDMRGAEIPENQMVWEAKRVQVKDVVTPAQTTIQS
ncbi:hypothetical protein P5673_022337 [Acropora cervicornis]|uniref:Uncharacterized protein n=1 Tax=Acropora cervicornis TaxID=6130 RepID=A0AAD9Q7E3_ACRCE|nr:hypothetical protein P5673_022337 [Acropora cervicornis]